MRIFVHLYQVFHLIYLKPVYFGEQILSNLGLGLGTIIRILGRLFFVAEKLKMGILIVFL
jgi:hypothetical protein